MERITSDSNMKMEAILVQQGAEKALYVYIYIYIYSESPATTMLKKKEKERKFPKKCLQFNHFEPYLSCFEKGLERKGDW